MGALRYIRDDEGVEAANAANIKELIAAMKRLAILMTTFVVLSACTPTAQPEPISPSRPAATATPVSAPAQPAADPATPAPASPAPAAPSPAGPAPTTPAPATAPSQPVESKPAQAPTAPLKNLVQVPVPAAAELPRAYRDVLMQRSPWEIAAGAALWFHGVDPYEGPFLAPALQAKLQAKQGAQRVWTTLIKSWDDGPGHFYFHIQAVAQRPDGAFYQAGLDVIEIAMVTDAGPVVTGYAHAPATSNAPDSPVKLWIQPGTDGAPRELRLANPVVQIDGVYHVPLAAVAEFVKLSQSDGGAYAAELGHGKLSAPFQTTTIKGAAYAAIADLVLVLDGQQAASAESTYTYNVQWQPELHQLLFRSGLYYPIS